MKTKLLTVLRKEKDYVSGQRLCEQFGVSRTAVWKAIEQLRGEGHVIEAVPRRGYRLLEQADGTEAAEPGEGGHSRTGSYFGEGGHSGRGSYFGEGGHSRTGSYFGEGDHSGADLKVGIDSHFFAAEIYSKSDIASRIETDWAGQQVYFYGEIGSTNIEAKRLAEAGAPHGTLVVADMQTAGRGRRGRSWSSPAGTNIYFTILLKPELAPDKASMLTLVIAHAIGRALRRILGVDGMASDGLGAQSDSTASDGLGAQSDGAVSGGLNVQIDSTASDGLGIQSGKAASDMHMQQIGIKWPNDIVIAGRKVCGILTEMSVEQDYIQHVVIGVGINIRRQEFAPEIADRAIALDELCPAGKRFNRSMLLAEIIRNFETDYEKFAEAGSMVLLKDTYDEMLVNKDREVCVLDPAGEYHGIARGINDKGELIVELPDGSSHEVYAGEVSVRGVYGYV